MPPPRRAPRKYVSEATGASTDRPNHSSFVRAEHSRVSFLAALRDTGNVQTSLAQAGVTRQVYEKWRLNHSGFKDKVREIQREFGTEAPKDRIPTTFAPYRKRYFGFDSPWFHLDIIKALEDSPPGSVTMILIPPEHGKTTLLEDFICYKLDQDRNFRITIGSEKQTHGKKIIARVKARMTPGSGPPQWLAECGPFAPPPGQRTPQIWAEDRFNVYGRQGDERDYSAIAQGITSSVVGSRADLLIVDDIQSRKSLSQSHDIFADLRQDWLSRTGAFGRVVIIGTRVGPGDVYELLEDSPVVNRVISIPAYRPSEDDWPPPQGHNPKEDPDQIPDHVGSFLWPERYTPLNYLVMRVNAGEEGWGRNFMQRGEASGAAPFTTELLAQASRAEFSCRDLHNAQRYKGELIVALDPGFGVNCTMLALMTERFVVPLLWRKDLELSNNQQIWDVCESVIYEGTKTGSPCTEMLIEDKAFQRGLLDDAGLHELRRRWGFSSRGHQTGDNKYDPDLGIPQLARAMDVGELLLPAADDETTAAARVVLDRELIKWRPYKRGNRLTQDLVITLWFSWMSWRRLRPLLAQGARNHQGWRGQALPSHLSSTGSGLVLPTGSYGR